MDIKNVVNIAINIAYLIYGVNIIDAVSSCSSKILITVSVPFSKP